MIENNYALAPAEFRMLATPEGPVVETNVRVRFAETDAMGVVYHTNYLIWFEVGRGAYWRALGAASTPEMQDAGSFPVSAAEAHFHAPARYGDLVVIRTRIIELRSRSITFGYECLLAESGARLAVGQTTHLFIDENGHARRLPDPLRRALTGATTRPAPVPRG